MRNRLKKGIGPTWERSGSCHGGSVDEENILKERDWHLRDSCL